MRKIVGIGICLIGILLPVGLYGLEEEEDNNRIETVIAFNLTAEDRFTYEVKVSEGGYLYDGSQRITNGIIAYELSVGQGKEFQIEAERGYEVKEIRVNDEAQNTNIERIKIAGVSANSVLEVRYGRIEEEAIPPDIDEEPDVSIPPENRPDVEETDDSKEKGQKDTEIRKPKDKEIEGKIPITGDMLRISEYVCLMLIILYRLYVSRRGIDTMKRVDNIAISGDIEKKQETLKEEKEDER